MVVVSGTPIISRILEKSLVQKNFNPSPWLILYLFIQGFHFLSVTSLLSDNIQQLG